MPTYFLLLGRLPQLSLAELENLFPDQTVTQIAEHYVSVEAVDDESFLNTITKAGGTIKAFRLLESISPDQEALNTALNRHYLTADINTFALTIPYQLPFPHPTAQEMKNELTKDGKRWRFIESGTHGVSAAILTHKKINELTVLLADDQLHILQTLWVQNIDEWSHRDYEKPRRDHKRGMIPPKLARMMVNFISPAVSAQEKKILYDPFCGMGTILMEGQLLGWKVIGSDASQQAVHDAAENLHWLAAQQNLPEPLALIVADVANAQLSEKVDAIVTEPFLGKQTPQPHELPNIFKGLEKQYWGAFKHWTKVLKPGGEVVIITPLVDAGSRRFSLEALIDKSRELGYTTTLGPVIYRRPQTVVQRAIYRLTWKKSESL